MRADERSCVASVEGVSWRVRVDANTQGSGVKRRQESGDVEPIRWCMETGSEGQGACWIILRNQGSGSYSGVCVFVGAACV